ncbi:fructosamine kinase family protein [Nocardioides sp. zg-1228]|uniref:fructosamine kinase family protein n=1 Tax=Nocardioides sp. zg-1228 TaxID=2763008 RepID=UPI00164327A3|nr:fructosamine kinase family protein [Nocardioides sp. zg-1228]MBC2931892.1 fructosamine kinase family protein [Nocardioides sp. zg-1228]QSF57456.1 fructosamine kinase family protein [Nocardioides sp. zg-1228]
MARQPLVARRAEELLGTAVVATSPVAGGDIATATRLRLSNGQTALMKTLPHAPEGFFEAEAAGLRWLGQVEGGVPVPELLAAAPDCLVLAWVEQSAKTPVEAAVTFGQQLAVTHAAGADGWGLDHDGFIGRLPLPNRTADSWAEFYAVRRVLPYLKLARDRGAITDTDAANVEAVIGRLSSLLPEEEPARLHGDLWNGNCLWGQDLAIHVIDPAAHGGHRELDLAMLHLFGLTHLPRVMAAYDEARPLADGWEDRLGIHQLFPLLVHACMFGGGYGARAGAVAARYA